jgi:antitoxin PrlF
MITSKITAKSQTTIPKGVRESLGIGPGDEVAYEIRGDQVVLTKHAEDTEAPDPVITAFLAFLESDMTDHPSRIRPLESDLAHWLRSRLTEAVADPDEAIEGEVAL